MERKRVELPLEELEPDGSFSGYASLFGTADLARDMIERGAFAKAIKRRGAAGIRMLFQHDPKEPIGVWTAIGEDRRGLKVEGRLTEGVARAREVAATRGVWPETPAMSCARSCAAIATTE